MTKIPISTNLEIVKKLEIGRKSVVRPLIYSHDSDSYGEKLSEMGQNLKTSSRNQLVTRLWCLSDFICTPL